MDWENLYDDPSQQLQQQTPPPPQEPLDDVVIDYLKSRGIDPDGIQFEDENEQISTRKWGELSREEQLNILNTPFDYQEPVERPDITDDEIALINQIRESQMSPQDYIESLVKPSEPQYNVDNLSDDELYILDLESRVGELPDEEALQALSVAKQNETFYKKLVDAIRKEYKEREDLKLQQEQYEIELQQQEAYNQYASNIVQAIDKFNSVGNLDLNVEDADKDELARFMLSQDDKTGVNYLYAALQDPETLVKAAWFVLKGDEVFNDISDYITNKIKLVSENQYKKGFADGQKGTTKPSVVILKPINRTPGQDLTLDNLYD